MADRGFEFSAKSNLMRDIVKMNVDDINRIGLEPGDWIQINFELGTIVGKIVEDEVEPGTLGLDPGIVKVFNLSKNQSVYVTPYTGPLPDRRFREI
jgi:anaerobic selenocysteine-containing dehydrogenase